MECPNCQSKSRTECRGTNYRFRCNDCGAAYVDARFIVHKPTPVFYTDALTLNDPALGAIG